MRIHKRVRVLLWLLIVSFLLLNIIAFVHAYKFTHFSTESIGKSSYHTTAFDKVKLLLTGINNPRPTAKYQPDTAYQKVYIQSNKKLEAWHIKVAQSKGTIVLFHGYGGEKSSMLDKSKVFNHLGFSTLLVDFMGAGGSEGNQTTIGYAEGEEVRDCFAYLKNKGEENIHLFGTSMGAVAIMRAVSEFTIKPSSIIIECPFGTMSETVKARFKLMGAPTFPMANLLLFWGGVQNGFWAFSHNPIDYSKKISCPTLLLYGEQDPKVSKEEINRIYGNLKGVKQLRTYPLAGHENYLIKYKEKWSVDVQAFLQ